MGIGTKSGIMALAGNAFSNLYSVDFDGVDDYVTMGNKSSLDFEQTDAFSISAWVKRNSTGNFHAIASKQDYNFNVMGQNSPGYSLFFNDDDTVRFLLAYIIATHRFIDIKTDNTITDTNWHHIVLTYDGTGGSDAKNGVEIYIDGTQQTVSRSGNLGAAVTTLTSAPFNIGARDDQNVFMDGKIDEVAVFNSELSASDITNIYNNGVPADLSGFESLVSWWRFEEGSGTTAIDSRTGGNNGTLTGGPTYSTDTPS